jgi:hypothetical protein
VIDLQQKLQANILDRLKRRKDQRLTRRDFDKAIKAIKKQFRTDADAIEQVVEALLREGYVSRTVRGTYRLETKGADYLAQIVPAAVALPPEINEALIPYQKAFVLMHLFCAEENTLTQSELFAKLEQPGVAESGLFLRLSTDPPVNPDRPTIEWVIAQLLRGGDIRERKSGRGARYWLTEHGQELLAATDQHPKIRYTVSGEKLNVLRLRLGYRQQVRRTAPNSHADCGGPTPQGRAAVPGTAPGRSRYSCVPNTVAIQKATGSLPEGSVPLGTAGAWGGSSGRRLLRVKGRGPAGVVGKLG